MIDFTCTRCGKALEAVDEFAGKQVRCQHCGAELQIPGSPAIGAVAAAAPKAGRGIAVTAIILGILGIIPVIGLLLAAVGLILGIIAMTRASQARASKGSAITGTVISGIMLLIQPIVLVLVAILVPVINNALADAQKTGCMANLKTIGGAIREYDRAKGRLPKDTQELIDMGLLPPAAFHCPADEDWAEGDNSYIFALPEGNQYDIHPEAWIACDKLDNHPDGRAVLTLAGNVAFMSHDRFMMELQHPRNAALRAKVLEQEGTLGP